MQLRTGAAVTTEQPMSFSVFLDITSKNDK
jgi:hypothetical protein